MTVSEIYTTAPTQGPEKVLESFALLNQLHIPYSRVEHEPAETMDQYYPDALGFLSFSHSVPSQTVAFCPGTYILLQ